MVFGASSSDAPLETRKSESGIRLRSMGQRDIAKSGVITGTRPSKPLVGVLIQFRVEKVASVADIESMFHQIRVDPKDQDVLRFLWRENGNLKEESKKNRMVKHVLWTTSLPSIANLGLKKMASTNSEEFDTDFTDSRKKHVC